jgi:hypothetical protein
MSKKLKIIANQTQTHKKKKIKNKERKNGKVRRIKYSQIIQWKYHIHLVNGGNL